MTEQYQNIVKKLEALRTAGLDFGKLQDDIRSALDRLDWEAKHNRMAVDNKDRTSRIAGLILSRISPDIQVSAEAGEGS